MPSGPVANFYNTARNFIPAAVGLYRTARTVYDAYRTQDYGKLMPRYGGMQRRRAMGGSRSSVLRRRRGPNRRGIRGRSGRAVGRRVGLRRGTGSRTVTRRRRRTKKSSGLQPGYDRWKRRRHGKPGHPLNALVVPYTQSVLRRGTATSGYGEVVNADGAGKTFFGNAAATDRYGYFAIPFNTWYDVENARQAVLSVYNPFNLLGDNGYVTPSRVMVACKRTNAILRLSSLTGTRMYVEVFMFKVKTHINASPFSVMWADANQQKGDATVSPLNAADALLGIPSNWGKGEMFRRFFRMKKLFSTTLEHGENHVRKIRLPGYVCCQRDFVPAVNAGQDNGNVSFCPRANSCYIAIRVSGQIGATMNNVAERTMDGVALAPATVAVNLTQRITSTVFYPSEYNLSIPIPSVLLGGRTEDSRTYVDMPLTVNQYGTGALVQADIAEEGEALP